MEASSAARSKSKDKIATKELPKSFSKPSVYAGNSSKTLSSGYDPHLGTFHMIETSKEFPMYGRFKYIDDMENLDGDSCNFTEDDSVSNDGSSSRELLLEADNDKREKSRRKNERKHQRQRERRAQELHDRCSSYLLSRKLESLAQQLVNMGFSHEQATLALILNEGRVEESVSWILKACEGDKLGEPNLKLDITEDLMRISDMETKYKASKQEIEKMVVAYEGDLDKVEGVLKGHSKEPLAIAPKREERSDPPPATIDPRLKSLQEPTKNMQPKLEWARAKTETRPPLENEMKSSQHGLVRETVSPMQRLQSHNAKMVPDCKFGSPFPGKAAARCSSNIDTAKAHKPVPPSDVSRSSGLNGFRSSWTDAQTAFKTIGNKSPFECLSVTNGRDRRSSTSHFDYKSIDWSSGLEQLIAESNGHSYGLSASTLGPKLPSSESFREWSSPFEERDLFSLQKLLLFSSSP